MCFSSLLPILIPNTIDHNLIGYGLLDQNDIIPMRCNAFQRVGIYIIYNLVYSHCLLYKSPDGGNVDGHACMHRYISIGRDNRYEQVEPQARIANTCQQHGSCYAAE